MRIMLNGRAYSGKDTVGDILCEKYGFKRIYFAEPIYEIAEKYLGMTEKERELLISVGQKMREINPNVWIDYLFNKVSEMDGDIVITDVRQANEYIAGDEAGFKGIRVTSSLENRKERCRKRDGLEPTEEIVALWESEGEIGADPFPYYEIENDDTYEDLLSVVDKAVRTFREEESKPKDCQV